jgi:hypothetical protein
MSTAVISVASYGFVLGGTMAAVTTASVVPAALVAAATILRELAENPPPDGTPRPAGLPDAETEKAAQGLLDLIPSGGGAVVKKAMKSIDGITLLVPKTARVQAEFNLEGREEYSGGVSVGGQLQAVSVSAGFSALIEQKSGFKVSMTIDYETAYFSLLKTPPPKPA